MSSLPYDTSSPSAYRRRIAEALLTKGTSTEPVGHWTQGLARLANALVGGMQMNQLATDRKAMMDGAMQELYGTGSNATPATGMQAGPQSQASYPPPSPSNTVGKIYSNDEPSPLDPPSGADRDMTIRTIVAEAGNQPDVGKQAVASVIRNRAVAGNYGGDTAGGVVRAPNQFEPWNTAEGRNRMAAIDPNSPQYQSAGAALDAAYTGADPTNGAVNFYAPKAQAALGRQPPAWAAGRQGQQIADHTFYGGANDPGALPPSAMPAQGFAIPGQQAAPAGMTAERRAKLGQIAMNEDLPAAMRSAALEQLKPKDAQLQQVGTDDFGKPRYAWVNSRDRSITEIGGTPQQSGPSVIPPPPAGVDPVAWRKQQTENYITNNSPGSFEQGAKLRGEVHQLPSFKNYSQALPIYQSMFETAGRDSKASDLNLVYGLGKIMDPTSVVREGEQVMVRNTAGIPEWLQGQINAVNGGAALTPETRQAIMNEAHSRMQSYEQVYRTDTQHYRRIAKNNRLSEDDIVPAFDAVQRWAPSPQLGPVAPAAPAAKQPPQPQASFTAVPNMPGVTWRVR